MKELRVVLEMAEEMSLCTSYGEHDDDDGEYLGVAPEIEDALEKVRAWLGSSKRAPSSARRKKA